MDEPSALRGRLISRPPVDSIDTLDLDDQLSEILPTTCPSAYAMIPHRTSLEDAKRSEATWFLRNQRDDASEPSNRSAVAGRFSATSACATPEGLQPPG